MARLRPLRLLLCALLMSASTSCGVPDSAGMTVVPWESFAPRAVGIEVGEVLDGDVLGGCSWNDFRVSDGEALFRVRGFEGFEQSRVCFNVAPLWTAVVGDAGRILRVESPPDMSHGEFFVLIPSNSPFLRRLLEEEF